MKVIDIQYRIEVYQDGRWDPIPLKVTRHGKTIYSTSKGGWARAKIRQLAGLYDKIRLTRIEKTEVVKYGR